MNNNINVNLNQAVSVDIICRLSDTFSLSIPFVTDETPFDFTDYTEIRMTVKKSPSSKIEKLVFSLIDNSITINENRLELNQHVDRIKELGEGSFTYELIITSPIETRTIMNGTFTVDDDLSVSDFTGLNVDIQGVALSSSANAELIELKATVEALEDPIVNLSDLQEKDYSSLTGKPELFSGSYMDLTGKPVLFSGDYGDLANKPTIPTVDVNKAYVDSEISKISVPDLTGYATEAWVNGKGYLTTHQDLSAYATQSWVNAKGYLTAHQSLTGYATESWVNSKGYLTTHQDLTGYATETWVSTQIANVSGGTLDYNDLINKPVIPSIDGLASETWVNSQGFLKTHQDISGKADVSYVDQKIVDLLDGASPAYNTLLEIENELKDNDSAIASLTSVIGNKADKTELFSGSYNDLTDKPTIPSLTGYATESWVNAKGYLTAHQDLSTYALKTELFSGNYNDLTNKPSIPSLTGYATEIWVNTQGFLTTHQDLSTYALKTELFSGSYNDLTDKPAIPSLTGYATEAWVNAKGYLTTHQDISGKADITWVNTQIAGISTFSGDYNDLINRPTLFSGSYTDLTNKPDLTGYASTTYVDTEIAGISTFSGNYNDLTNKPSIPGTLAELTADATHRTVTDVEKSDWNNAKTHASSTHAPTDAEANDPNTTLAGNVFNGPDQLLKLDEAGKLPALDGSQLTGIVGGDITSVPLEYCRAKVSTAQVLNTTGSTDMVFATADANSDAAKFTVEAGGIKVIQSGRYEVKLHHSLISTSTQRPDPILEVIVNATSTGYQSREHYARNTSGIDESTASVSVILDLNANDVIGMRLTRNNIDMTSVSTINANSWIEISEHHGVKGDKGDIGSAGLGVPAGGGTGQVLAKKSGTDNDTEWLTVNVGDSPTRNTLGTTDIDFQASYILTYTMAANTAFTISNPVLDKVITVELAGDFAPTLPGSCIVKGDTYDGTNTNYVYIHCVDATTPKYVATILNA